MQIKMISALAYLVDDPASISYLNTAGVGLQKDNTVAPYWFVRHGSADSDAPVALEAMFYFALYNNPSVKDLDFAFAWRKGHSDFMGTGYEAAGAWAWIDSVIYRTDHAVVTIEASAFVTKLNGNRNDLTITVIEYLRNGTINVLKETFSINNNAASTYNVGLYRVYVDTKGNDQIRACYIVE
jgi:hypothetical protein